MLMRMIAALRIRCLATTKPVTVVAHVTPVSQGGQQT